MTIRLENREKSGLNYAIKIYGRCFGGSMTYSKNGDKRIESLQALRAIAFIGIFLSHAGSPFKRPTLGVLVFYVMWVFMMRF